MALTSQREGAGAERRQKMGSAGASGTLEPSNEQTNLLARPQDTDCETSVSLVSFPSPVHLPTFLLPICLSSYLRHPSPYLSDSLCLSSDLSIQPSIYLYACASNCPSMCLLFICLSVCPPVGLSLGKFGLPMTLGLDGTWQTWYFSSAFATCRLNKILRIGRPAQQDAAP